MAGYTPIDIAALHRDIRCEAGGDNAAVAAVIALTGGGTVIVLGTRKEKRP